MSARWIFGWLPFVLVWAVIGCNAGGADIPASQLHIETVADWYQSYRAAHDGKAPANEKAFIEYIQRKLKETGQSIDVHDLLTSPRDGQRYVVNYKPNSSSLHKNVAVYEREGLRGTRWLAFENKWSEEVDDQKLQEYLARK
jgi:hypothetical protein